MTDCFAKLVLVACLCFGLVLPAAAQPAATPAPRIELSGEGIQATVLDRDSLSGMPRVEADVSFMTAKGEHRGRYAGVLLLTVLQRAGLAAGDPRHSELGRSFLVTGRDGYAVAFSVGEIEADFGGRAAMIALTENGKPLSEREGLRLIVPGDKRGARSVMDVVRIEVR